MQVQQITNMFNFTFQKTTSEIVGKAMEKAVSIRAKIGERELRIAKVRKEYKIGDREIIELLTRARAAMTSANAMLANYSTTVESDDGEVQEVTVGAGIINMLLTEQDFIEGEKAQCERLDVIARHLCDVWHVQNGTTVIQKKHTLSYAELKFLGF